MKKILTALVMSIYLLSSIIAVLAVPTTVTSNPALFALIKTDTSKNNTVTVHGDRLSFNPGRGMGGNMYGFQPNSVYYYKDLFKVKNITNNDLSIWYTLDGQMKNLNAEGIFCLDVADASGDKWNPEQVIVLPAKGETGGIDFLFAIPSKQPLGSYSGSITVHAAQDSPVPGPAAITIPNVPVFTPPEPVNAPDTNIPVDMTALTVPDDASGTDKPDGLVVPPEAPEVDPGIVKGLTLLNYWPLLLLLLIPPLIWFMLASRVLVLVPDDLGEYKIVARKFAGRRNKKWFVNIEKQLNKYLVEHGLIVVDFRGGLLKKARKTIYSGDRLIGASDLRYALIGSQRVATWTDQLQKRTSRAAG